MGTGLKSNISFFNNLGSLSLVFGALLHFHFQFTSTLMQMEVVRMPGQWNLQGMQNAER